MATVTVTMSQLSPNVKAVHTGLNVVASHWSASATFSPSGILNMVRLPHGATVVDFWGKIAQGGAAQTLKIGTSNTPSGIMSIMTLCQTFSLSASVSLDVLTLVYEGPMDQKWFRAPGGTRGGTGDLLPVRISLSDDAQPSNIWVQGRLGAAISASALFTFCLFYTMDGLIGRTTIR